jgi:hypothetical protein
VTADVALFAVSVRCEARCDRDEQAVIVQDAARIFTRAEIDVLALDQMRGFAALGKIQAAVCDMVDNWQDYLEEFSDEDPTATDSALAFLIVARDAILAHRYAETTVTVTT